MKIYNKEKWEKVKLGEIFELQMGKTPSRNKENYWRHGENSWISISDMKNEEKYICDTKEKITDLAVEESKIKVIPKDTVIMSFKLSIGKLAITSKDMFTNEAIMAFFPKDKVEIDNNYLFYSLKKVNWTEGTNKAVKGLTLNKPLIASKEIFLPNMKIQKEIAKRLDIVMEILKIKRKILLQLDELSKSIFIKLKLKNKNWDIKSFAEVTKVSQGLQIPISKRKKENGKNRFKYITIQFLNGSKEVEYIENPRENVICSEEDILMTRTGNTGMVVTGVSGVFHNNFFIVKYDKNILLKEYLVAYLNSKEVQEEIKKRAGTSTIPDLNHGEFYKIKILIPPINFQEKFSKQIQVIAKSKVEGRFFRSVA